jgi:hypothetical protein
MRKMTLVQRRERDAKRTRARLEALCRHHGLPKTLMLAQLINAAWYRAGCPAVEAEEAPLMTAEEYVHNVRRVVHSCGQGSSELREWLGDCEGSIFAAGCPSPEDKIDLH